MPRNTPKTPRSQTDIRPESPPLHLLCLPVHHQVPDHTSRNTPDQPPTTPTKPQVTAHFLRHIHHLGQHSGTATEPHCILFRNVHNMQVHHHPTTPQENTKHWRKTRVCRTKPQFTAFCDPHHSHPETPTQPCIKHEYPTRLKQLRPHHDTQHEPTLGHQPETTVAGTATNPTYSPTITPGHPHFSCVTWGSETTGFRELGRVWLTGRWGSIPFRSSLFPHLSYLTHSYLTPTPCLLTPHHTPTYTYTPHLPVSPTTPAYTCLLALLNCWSDGVFTLDFLGLVAVCSCGARPLVIRPWFRCVPYGCELTVRRFKGFKGALPLHGYPNGVSSPEMGLQG